MGEVPPCTDKQLIRALHKVGIEVVKSSGKGSHTKVRDPKSGRSTTIPRGQLTFVREGIVKWAVSLGYSKKEILKYL